MTTFVLDGTGPPCDNGPPPGAKLAGLGRHPMISLEAGRRIGPVPPHHVDLGPFGMRTLAGWTGRDVWIAQLRAEARP